MKKKKKLKQLKDIDLKAFEININKILNLKPETKQKRIFRKQDLYISR